jgi:hypothetical protein
MATLSFNDLQRKANKELVVYMLIMLKGKLNHYSFSLNRRPQQIFAVEEAI